jgi:hypothetical protein
MIYITTPINSLKSRSLSAFTAILLLVCLSFSGQAQSVLKGKVSDKKGAPIPFASVYLKKTQAGATTDTAGFFSIGLTSTDPDTLVASFVGYDDFVRPFTAADTAKLFSIVLKESEETLDEIVISAGMIEANNERAVAVLKPLDIVTTAGAQGDIVGAIQTLPGVQRNGGDQTGLMVRGGDVNESVMIIDGTIAQNAFYSSVPGVAQRSRFNPFQFKGTSFSSGGYTARYGQALSAVLDLQTNDLPEKSNINIGLMMSGASISGSKLMGNNAIEFSGSYTNLSPFLAVNKTNVNFFHAPEGAGFSTRFISKTNDEKGLFKMNFTHAYNVSGTTVPDPETAGAHMDFRLQNENTFFNTSFKYWASPKLKYFTAFSFSNNTDNIRLDSTDLYRNDGRVQGRAEVWYEAARKFNILAGTELQRISYTQRYDTLAGRFEETLTAGYAEAEYKPAKWFALKPGVRAEYSQIVARGNVVPRLAFAVRTGKGSQVSFAGGMFYQTAPSQYLLQGYRPGFQQAVHYMLNYQVIRNDRTFRVEAYYKSYAQLIREKGLPYTPNQYRLAYGLVDNSGNGYAQGVDIFWRDKKSIKNFDYWISYSYIDTKRLYQNYIVSATPDYVSTNNLNVVAKYFFEAIQTNISASYNYSSGRAYYDPNASGFLSNHAPDYQNLALTLSYLTTIKNVFCVFFLSADNILDHHNVLGYRYSYTGNERYPVLPPMYRSIFVGMNLSLSKFKQDEL